MTESTYIPAQVPAKAGTNPSSLTIVKHNSFADEPVLVRNPPGGEVVDYVSDGVHLKRVGNNSGLRNIVVEDSYDSDVSPVNTSWNANGWEDLHLLPSRNWTNFRNAIDENSSNIVGSEFSKLVMRDDTTGKYYKVQFHFWQASNTGGDGVGNPSSDDRGGFSYTRQEIFMPESVSFIYPGSGAPGDSISEYVTVVRDSAGGIYNSLLETQWNASVSPAGLLWNAEGWENLSDITTREYYPLHPVTGALGNYIQNKDYVMYDVEADEYYQVKFNDWQGDGDGEFAYVRTKLNKWAAPAGITFGDGTVQKNAAGEGLDRIKAEYWGYPDETIQIKNSNDADAIALASTSHAIVRWQSREESEGVAVEALIEKVNVDEGVWLVTLSVNPDRVMLSGFPYQVISSNPGNGDFSGTFLADSGGEGTITLVYNIDPEGDPTGCVITGPSNYSQVQANDEGVFIKNAAWNPGEGGSYQYVWQFQHDGGLRFPDGTVQYTAWLD